MMRRTRYSLLYRLVHFLIRSKHDDVLTWPTYYSIGNVQLIHHPVDQALVEKR